MYNGSCEGHDYDFLLLSHLGHCNDLNARAKEELQQQDISLPHRKPVRDKHQEREYEHREVM